MIPQNNPIVVCLKPDLLRFPFMLHIFVYVWLVNNIHEILIKDRRRAPIVVCLKPDLLHFPFMLHFLYVSHKQYP